jgi:hypothetical protein
MICFDSSAIRLLVEGESYREDLVEYLRPRSGTRR